MMHLTSMASTYNSVSRSQKTAVPIFRTLKSNAFEIECPAEVLQFDLKIWPKERVWAYLRETAGERPLVAVPLRKVLAFGTIEDPR